MDPIEPKPPHTLLVAPDEVRIEIFAPQNVYDPDSGALTDIHIVPTLVLAEKNNIGERIHVPVDPQRYSEAVYRRFNDFTYAIGKMRRLAELNLDTLADTLALYLRAHPLAGVLDRNAACRRMQESVTPETFDRLTFENLRGLL